MGHRPPQPESGDDETYVAKIAGGGQVVNIITRTSHYESLNMSGTGFILNHMLIIEGRRAGDERSPNKVATVPLLGSWRHYGVYSRVQSCTVVYSHRNVVNGLFFNFSLNNRSGDDDAAHRPHSVCHGDGVHRNVAATDATIHTVISPHIGHDCAH